jgi:hypothetical protein
LQEVEVPVEEEEGDKEDKKEEAADKEEDKKEEDSKDDDSEGGWGLFLTLPRRGGNARHRGVGVQGVGGRGVQVGPCVFLWGRGGGRVGGRRVQN